MTDKLKPCPHCEQIPKRHIFEDGSGFITCKCDKLTGGTTIFANWRRPDGKITKRRKEVSSFSEHEADIIWNSRPIEDALKARIAELEAENARLEKLNSAALEKLSYLACPPNRNNYGLPCNDSDDCVACWCEYLGGCG